MKERPVLFSGAMVRAILDGSKTQTRRLCKPMNAWVNQACREVRMVAGMPFHFLKGASECIEMLRSPYGQPGDRLWVKETHLAWWAINPGSPEGPRIFSHVAAFKADGYELEAGEKWIPSIHMRRAASRILLEVVSVRVERLNDCSEADAKAEGCEKVPYHCAPGYEAYTREYREGYRKLWNDINGAGSWEANPWVWVIEFKRLEAA